MLYNQLRSSAPSRRKRPLSDCSNDSILNCENSLPCKRLSLSRSVVNISVTEKDVENNEPIVSMDHVSIREDDTAHYATRTLAGIKDTADTV